MIKVIAYQSKTINGEVLVEDSEGNKIQSSDPEELLSFISKDYSDKANKVWDLKVSFDLDEFITPIIKTLGLNACRELAGDKHQYKDIFYIPSKILRLEYGGHKSYIYHLQQYFPDYLSDDLQRVVSKTNEVLKALQQINMSSLSLTSPIAIYEKQVLERLNVPNVTNVPHGCEEAITYAEECCRNGSEWVESFQVGHWNDGEIFEYDISCYSEDTEALTINGWKLIKDLNIGEQILGFNPTINKCSFQPVMNMTIAPYHGKLVQINSTKIDLLLTPNHKVLYKDSVRCKGCKEYKKNGHITHTNWKIKEASDLPNGNIRMPVSFPITDRKEYPISDEMLQLIAWINTEGWIHKQSNKKGEIWYNYISFEQSLDVNAHYCKEITSVLNTLKVPYTSNIRNKPYKHEIQLIKNRIIIERTYYQHSIVFRISTEYSKSLPLDKENLHYFPLWILQQCSLRQLRIYYDTLMKGDGARTYDEKRGLIKSAFFTKLPVNKDRMQYLCHLLGYKVNCQNPNTSHTTYQISISEDRDREKNPNIAINYEQDIIYGRVNKDIDYNGLVSCPTIDDGYLVIRRNGKSCICGNSAYPNFSAKLYDIRYSTFVKSNKLIPATYGFLHGKVTIHDDVKVSPVLYRDENDSMISPVGSWETYITLDKLNFIKKWGIGEFELYDGWFINFQAPVQPLAIPMRRLFDLRQQGDMVKSLVKRMAVGTAGKFLERHDDGTVGKFYNPIYAAQVRTGAMLQLADFIYENQLQDSMVHVGVDSAMTTKKVNLPVQSGMGTWREENIGATLVMSSGRVYHGNKKPQGLNYDQIIKMIKDHPKDNYYTMGLMRPQTLAESIQLNDFEGLGKMKDTDSSFDLNLLRADQDRIFSRFPSTGKDLINNKYLSKPRRIME
jgi:hypothetical protein